MKSSSLEKSPKMSKLTVMHLKPFKSRYVNNHNIYENSISEKIMFRYTRCTTDLPQNKDGKYHCE